VGWGGACLKNRTSLPVPRFRDTNDRA
jgi:hypothetical protein